MINSERKQEFIKKLVLSALERELDNLLRHELVHVIQAKSETELDQIPSEEFMSNTMLLIVLFSTDLAILHIIINSNLDLRLSTNIGIFLLLLNYCLIYSLAYFLHPHEIDARKFVKKHPSKNTDRLLKLSYI